MWLLHFFMKKREAAALISGIVLLSKSGKLRKEGMLTSYSEVINYFLKTCAIDDVLPGMDTEALLFTQLSRMSLTGSTEALWG